MVKSTEKSTESNLKDNITLLSSGSCNCGYYTVSIVGATLHKSDGDVNNDVLKVGCGLNNESVDESTARGFGLGFYNAKAEIKKKDAYLSLYLKFQLNDENKTQRDSIIPDINISAKDNQNSKLDLMYYSNKDKYINLQAPNAVIILKTYYDAQSFEIQIKDKKFMIDASILK